MFSVLVCMWFHFVITTNKKLTIIIIIMVKLKEGFQSKTKTAYWHTIIIFKLQLEFLLIFWWITELVKRNQVLLLKFIMIFFNKTKKKML